MRPLSAQQLHALRVLLANGGEASSDTFWMEGLGHPTITLKSLRKRGLIKEIEWVDEHTGYLYEITDKGREAV